MLQRVERRKQAGKLTRISRRGDMLATSASFEGGKIVMPLRESKGGVDGA
jgi:hypothetical protein